MCEQGLTFATRTERERVRGWCLSSERLLSWWHRSPLCDHLLPSKQQPRDTVKGEGRDTGHHTPPTPDPTSSCLQLRLTETQ